jgi:hypothetical protein
MMLICGNLISCKKKEEAPAPASAPAPESASSTPDTAALLQKGQGAPAEKRKIILNHAIVLEVKSVPASLEALKKLAESNGGYVFNSTRAGNDSNGDSGQVGIRIPSGRADGVMKSIRGMGRVESENSTAEDITEEYVDLEARLNNAKSSETRLLGLYNKAGKLADVLAVEKELTRVRGDIESFEAKKKNWDILTAMVTIEISLHEPSGGFPSGHRFWSTIKGAFGKAVEVIADSLHALIIFVAGVLPWLAVFGPIIYLLVKWRRKKKREKIAKAGTAEAQQGEVNREQGKAE